MNSGKGIVHSERPAKEIASDGGDFELIQFWVNAPAKHKFDPPSYQPLSAEDTPTFQSKDGKVSVGVAAGELNGTKGTLQGNSNLLTARMTAESGGSVTLNVPQSYNALIYILDGKAEVNGQSAKTKDMIVFERDGDEIEINALEDTRAILLAGEPINEPVVSYGPFVMNSEKEIMEAIRDYQAGKLGVLEENFDS